VGYETDTSRQKIGDGVTPWNTLSYITVSSFSTVNVSTISIGNVDSSIIPAVDSLYDLGAPGTAFRSLYVAGNTIYLGKATLSSDTDGNLSVLNSNGETTTVNVILSTFSTLTVSTINGLPFTGSGGQTVSTYNDLHASTFTVSTINGLPFTGSGSQAVSTYNDLHASTFTVSSLTTNSAQIPALTGVTTINGLPFTGDSAVSTFNDLHTSTLTISTLNGTDDTHTISLYSFNNPLVTLPSDNQFAKSDWYSYTSTNLYLDSASLIYAPASGVQASRLTATDADLSTLTVSSINGLPFNGGGGGSSTYTTLFTSSINTDGLQSNVNSYITVNASLIPSTDNTFDLGAPGSSFRSLYVGASTIHIGNAVISAKSTGDLIFINTLTNQSTSNTVAPPTVSGTLAGNMNMTGGGIVTWSSDTIGWSQDVTIVTNPSNASNSLGTIVKIAPSTVMMDGLDSLYYAPPVGTSSVYDTGALHIINGADQNHEPIADNWFLLANTSADNSIIKWNPANVVLPATSHYNPATARTITSAAVRWNPTKYNINNSTDLGNILVDIANGTGVLVYSNDQTAVTLTLPSTYSPAQGDMISVWNTGIYTITVNQANGGGTTGTHDLFSVPSSVIPETPAAISSGFQVIFDASLGLYVLLPAGTSQQLPGDDDVDTPRQPPVLS